MHIRRKVFSSVVDEETGEKRLFSVTELEQKEFNSPAMKLLRNKQDIKTGLKKIKELRTAFKPEFVGERTIENAKHYGREINRTFPLHSKSLNEKIARKGRIRDLQKEGLIDNYSANSMVQETMSPGLSGRVLRRKYLRPGRA